jgi:hypothetical protein
MRDLIFGNMEMERSGCMAMAMDADFLNNQFSKLNFYTQKYWQIAFFMFFSISFVHQLITP